MGLTELSETRVLFDKSGLGRVDGEREKENKEEEGEKEVAGVSYHLTLRHIDLYIQYIHSIFLIKKKKMCLFILCSLFHFSLY